MLTVRVKVVRICDKNDDIQLSIRMNVNESIS